MDEIQILASIIETLGTIGLLLLWLRDKNDQLSHERTSRHELSSEIIEDWKDMRKDRSGKE